MSNINDWNNSSENCHVSLKATFVLLVVGQQKPRPKFKTKDHQDALSKRLVMCKEGEILHKCRITQGLIWKLKGAAPRNKTKVLAKLVIGGQIDAVSLLQFVCKSSSGGVTPYRWRNGAAKGKTPQSTALLFGPIHDEITETLCSEINGDMVRKAALQTKGAGGPMGIQANGFHRIIARKSYKQSSSCPGLCVHNVWILAPSNLL